MRRLFVFIGAIVLTACESKLLISQTDSTSRRSCGTDDGACDDLVPNGNDSLVKPNAIPAEDPNEDVSSPIEAPEILPEVTVNIGPDRAARSRFTLTADVKGATSVKWSQVAGPGTVSFSAPSAASTEVDANKDGIYRLQLTARSGSVLVTDEFNLEWDATPPLVDAGQDQSIQNFASLMGVTGGDAVTMRWTQVSGPGTTSFASEAAANTTVTFGPDGVYVLRLTVADALGNTASDDIQIIKDSTAPPALASFSASIGTPGHINVAIDFPLDTTDYDRVELRRKVGLVAPAASCDTDTLVTTFNSFSNTVFDDADVSPTGIYSYRACLYDTLNNMSTSIAMTAENIFNVAPSLTFTAPVANDDAFTIGTVVPISWTDTDPDSNAMISLFYRSEAAGDCNVDGTPIATAISENDATDALNWDTTGLADGFYYICAKIDDGVNPPVTLFSGRVVLYPTNVCTWVGDTSSEWTTGTNWVGCTGHPDVNTESVLILAQAVQMPTLSASKTIFGFASGVGGGQLTITAGVNLTVTDAVASISSNVSIKGDTATCTTCQIVGAGHLQIVDNAALILESGATVKLNHNFRFYVGNSNSPGHLIADNQGLPENEWPIINFGSGFTGIVVQGTATDKSSIYADGLSIRGIGPYDAGLRFTGYYDVKKLDNVVIHGPTTHTVDGVQFQACSQATFTDTQWDNLKFDFMPSSSVISTAGCTVPITIGSCSGMACGAATESDPANVIAWPNYPTSTCLWNTTTGDTTWDLASNWLNCDSSVPDAVDYIDIPSGGTQPILAQTTGVRGTRGGGGGTINLATGATLWFLDSSNTIQSNIGFDAVVPTCTTCQVTGSSHITVNNNATLTLYNGITLHAHRAYGSTLRIGRNGSAGHLVARGGTDPTEFSSITTGWNSGGANVITGVAGQLSSVDLDGVISNTLEGGLHFADYYEVVRMDRVIFLGSGSSSINSSLVFRNCHNATFADEWNNLTFRNPPSAGNYSIDLVDGTDCNGVVPLTISAHGPGSGPVNANDPVGKITWTSSCAGTLYGGFCWYQGAAGESCTNVCASHGGNQAGTLYYTGSQGFLAECDAVLELFLGSVTTSNISSPAGLGCFFDGTARNRSSTTTTTFDAFSVNHSRVCACQE